MRRPSEPSQSFDLGDVCISAEEGLIVVKHAAKEERVILGRIDGSLLAEVFTALANAGRISEAAMALRACSACVRINELTSRRMDNERIEDEAPGLDGRSERRHRGRPGSNFDRVMGLTPDSAVAP